MTIVEADAKLKKAVDDARKVHEANKRWHQKLKAVVEQKSAADSQFVKIVSEARSEQAAWGFFGLGEPVAG